MTQIKDRYLSDIAEGKEVVIQKIKGYGAFRKRITEMGFTRGTVVKVIKMSPLKDPIEYELMGYRISLRKSEAELIKVISTEDAQLLVEHEYNGITIDDVKKIVTEKDKNINVALVGNPNCGKTTLFNLAANRHEHVGNYSGVTVDIKTAVLHADGYDINLTDLPGTYSLSEYSPEERFVREHLTQNMPDVVVNVVDASNLERNLYLTTQLIDMNVRVIVVLNMYDALERDGCALDYKALSLLFGCPIIPTIATKGVGVEEMKQRIISVYEETDDVSRHIHINYGKDIAEGIFRINKILKTIPSLVDKFHTRYLAVKLLEGDSEFLQLPQVAAHDKLLKTVEKEQAHLRREFDDDTQTIISDAKYSFIKGALSTTFTPSEKSNAKRGYEADVLMTNKILGIPVFLMLMWGMFQMTFSLGSIPMGWIESGVSWLSGLLSNNMSPGMLRDLLVDGVIGGVGGVIIFLPNILILFFCISLMEDTGYMARTAFIMDRAMHKIGLHGKSFIPMLMGFGCNVPAIMATRTLENKKDRVITMLIIPLMSCSARLPIYVLLTSAFFNKNEGFYMLLIYGIGVLLAAGLSLLLNRIFFHKQDVPFVMELPPYRTPTLKNTAIHMWEKSMQYLSKMGGIILIASILIWALGYFPREVEFSRNYEQELVQLEQNTTLDNASKEEALHTINIQGEGERLEKSYIGRIGKTIEPVISPLGFDWKIGVSLLSGVAAKEIVVSTMAVLYQTQDGDDTENLKDKLRVAEVTSGPRQGQKAYTPLIAFVLMLFILIYFPCVAVVSAIRRELGNKWALFTMCYTTLLAWVVSFAVYQVGILF